MITWLQRIFDRHKYLVVILFTLVIVSFVFVINESGGLVNERDILRKEDYFGVNLNSQQTISHLRSDLRLIQIMYGDARPMQIDEERSVMEYRLPFLYIAKQLNIPAPTGEQLVASLAQYPIFNDQNGKFSPQAVADFEDFLKSDPRFSPDQFARVISENYQIQQVQDLLMGAGYIPPYLVTKYLEINNARWDVLLASMSYEGFNPGEIEVSEADLEAYYRSNAVVYETPERRSGYLVRFVVDDFIANSEVDDKTLQQYFERNIQRYMSSDDAEIPEFASVKERVLRDYLKSLATRDAVTAANEFVEYLYGQATLPAQEDLSGEVSKHRGKIQQLPLFASGQAVEGVDLLPYELMGMFSIGDSYYSKPLSREGQEYIILLCDKIEPAQLPPLADQLARVKADYLEAQKRNRFREQGAKLAKEISEKVKEGGDFTKVASELGFSVKEFSGVGIGAQPEGFPGNIAELNYELARSQPHQVSRFSSDLQNGYVLYFKSVEQIPATPEAAARVEQDMFRFYRGLLPTILFREYIMRNGGGLVSQQ
jgi:hypothetical protein